MRFDLFLGFGFFRAGQFGSCPAHFLGAFTEYSFRKLHSKVHIILFLRKSYFVNVQENKLFLRIVFFLQGIHIFFA